MVKCGTEIENCVLMDFFIVRKKEKKINLVFYYRVMISLRSFGKNQYRSRCN